MSFNKNTQKSSKSTLGFGNYGRYICSNGFGLGAVERQPVRGKNCAKPVLAAGGII